MKFWLCGSEKTNRRMTVDHIDPDGPSTWNNTRPLCYSCNSIRGKAILTDEEVLRKMRFWYSRYFSPRFLYWLNSTPGQGGTLYRSKYTESRDRRLDEKAN